MSGKLFCCVSANWIVEFVTLLCIIQPHRNDRAAQISHVSCSEFGSNAPSLYMPFHQHASTLALASMFQMWSFVLAFVGATNRNLVLFVSSPSSDADRPKAPSNPVIHPSSTRWRRACPREPVQWQFSHGMQPHGCTGHLATMHEEDAWWSYTCR